MTNQLKQVFIDASSKNQMCIAKTNNLYCKHIHYTIYVCAGPKNAREIIISTYQNAAGVWERYGIWKNAFLVPLVWFINY